jgi:hypothetical protein
VRLLTARLLCLLPPVHAAAAAATAAVGVSVGTPQVFLTMTPKVNEFFNMAAMTGLQWLRVFVTMCIVYGVVEVEKALVDPLLMPMIKPFLRWCEAHTPQFLSVDQPLSARMAKLCGGKALGKAGSFTTQRRGTTKRCLKAHTDGNSMGKEGGGDGVGEAGAGAAAAAAPEGVAVEMQAEKALNARQLSAVCERGHSQH